MLTYHGAAERPEPPHQQQSQQQEHHQQRYEHDGAVKLGESSGDESQTEVRGQERRRRKEWGEKKGMYSQPPLMDRHNRGDLRERGRLKSAKKGGVKEIRFGPQRKGTADGGDGGLTHSVVVM